MNAVQRQFSGACCNVFVMVTTVVGRRRRCCGARYPARRARSRSIIMHQAVISSIDAARPTASQFSFPHWRLRLCSHHFRSQHRHATAFRSDRRRGAGWCDRRTDIRLRIWQCSMRRAGRHSRRPYTWVAFARRVRCVSHEQARRSPLRAAAQRRRPHCTEDAGRPRMLRRSQASGFASIAAGSPVFGETTSTLSMPARCLCVMVRSLAASCRKRGFSRLDRKAPAVKARQKNGSRFSSSRSGSR